MTVPTETEKRRQEREKAKLWLRVMLAVLLLSPPAYLFIQAGRQIDINRNLLAAIRRNDANTVEFLLSAGADANARDSSGDTRPMLRQILDRLRGIPTPPGHSALQASLEEKPGKKIPDNWEAPPENIKIIQALLDHHADPNVRGEYEATPLMLAAQQNKEATVQALLKGGAKVDWKDFQGTDALHFAAEAGSTPIVQMLLDAGAEVNSRDSEQNTPLMEAVTAGNEPVVTLLIARGADVNAKDSAEDSALTYALRAHSASITALLKKAGAH